MSAGTAIVKIGVGLDLAGTALVGIPIQPHFSGIAFAQEIFTPGGVVRNSGYAALRFPPMTNDEYQSVLSVCGLGSAEFALCTLELPDEDRDDSTRWNCRVVKPRGGWQIPLYRSIEMSAALLAELP